MSWIIFAIVIVGGSANVCCDNPNSVNNTIPNINHVCHREETYIEQIEVPVKQQVRIRSSNWCLEMPPRCSNYKTETRDVVKLQNVTKTRITEYCCEGYAEIIAGNETVCKPICRGGCGRGICHTPNECHCDPGYIGRHCTHRCQHGRWGEGCRFICKCRNGALCDNRTGKCRCMDGWMGLNCDQSCPEGFFGSLCKLHCECSSKKCDPVHGECIPEDGIILEDTNDIGHNHPEGKHQSALLAANDTSMIIESLNSSIANLTENIDKLTKNLNRSAPADSVTVIVPSNLMEATTPKTVHEVIVIKPNDVMTSTAIIVPPPHESRAPLQVGPPSPLAGELNNADATGHYVNRPLEGPATVHSSNEHKSESDYGDHLNGGINAVLVVVAIFSLAILACSIGFVVLYRRHLMKIRDGINGKVDEESKAKEDAKVFTKPLPDLPAFTQNLTRQSYVPEFYDRPSNNAAVKASNLKENQYSGVSSDYSVRPFPKPYPRKGSGEHLYDEINYNTKSQCSRV